MILQIIALLFWWLRIWKLHRRNCCPTELTAELLIKSPMGVYG